MRPVDAAWFVLILVCCLLVAAVRPYLAYAYLAGFLLGGIFALPQVEKRRR